MKGRSAMERYTFGVAGNLATLSHRKDSRKYKVKVYNFDLDTVIRKGEADTYEEAYAILLQFAEEAHRGKLMRIG